MFYSTKVVWQLTDRIGEYIVVEKDLREWIGPIDRMCGPTAAQTGLQAQSQDMATTLQNSYSTLFGQQQGTLANLNSSVQKIATGQTGPGFSGAENATRISEIQANGGAAGRNAAQAATDAISGQGGGGASGIRTGTQGVIRGQAASAAADQEAGALDENTVANYQQGRLNQQAAASGYANLAGEESPNAAAQSEISSNNESFGQATQIQQEDNALAKDIAGGVTALAGDALTGGMSGLMGAGGGGGSSVDQVMQESQGNNSDNYIQQPYAPTVAPAMAFPG